MQRLKPPTHHLPHRLDLRGGQCAATGERHVAVAELGPGVGGDMRLGQNDDGTQALGLELVVRTGYGCQSRSLGSVVQNRLNGGKIVECVRLGSTDLVADRTQAHRTHASTVATWTVPDKRGEIPICACPASGTRDWNAVAHGAAGLFSDAASAASVDRAVAIGPGGAGIRGTGGIGAATELTVGRA